MKNFLPGNSGASRYFPSVFKVHVITRLLT